MGTGNRALVAVLTIARPCLDFGLQRQAAPEAPAPGADQGQAIKANTSWKAPIVASTSASEWAKEVKPAS